MPDKQKYFLASCVEVDGELESRDWGTLVAKNAKEAYQLTLLYMINCRGVGDEDHKTHRLGDKIDTFWTAAGTLTKNPEVVEISKEEFDVFQKYNIGSFNL
jgi:hypothetical protein